MSICLTLHIDRYETIKIMMLSLRDMDLGVTQLPRTNNSVFNLLLKISRIADVLTCSDSSLHTMGAEKQKAD